ncbi:MAG TPA: PEGA domain-containing protein [Sandaracinaceae bacterium LLY-WYZ-13_1]|nr:PEGA domain-containing protein [Sandaracinaceae bacterium LLY-WYZ-13_1]
MTPFRRVLFPALGALAATVVLTCLGPSVASAQTDVMVLGVRSVEGDDEFTRNLTGALRHEASQVDGWEVSEREVTLSQMSLAHGCEEPDPTCMAQIAESLEADKVVYGEVRRTSAGEEYDFSVNLHVFDAASGEIERSVAETIPGIRRDIDDLREPSRRYVAALSGAPRLGTVHVSVNVPGAEVFMDGESAGVTDDDGELVIENAQAGSRNLRIVAEGHQSFRSTVSVEAYGEATFEAELEEGGDAGGGFGSRDLDLALGISLTGVGVALAAAWIGSWAYLRFVWETQDTGAVRSEWTDARNAFLPPENDGPEDICDPNAEPVTGGGRGWVDDLCDERGTLEALPFVFGISAAVIGGVGLYFLISALTSEDEAASVARHFRLEPSLGPQHAYLGVRFAL